MKMLKIWTYSTVLLGNYVFWGKSVATLQTQDQLLDTEFKKNHGE